MWLFFARMPDAGYSSGVEEMRWIKALNGAVAALQLNSVARGAAFVDTAINMKKVKDLMNRDAQVISPDESIMETVQQM